MRALLSVLAIVVIALASAWASDAITLQGERTIYTVECKDGQWQGAACTGRLVAGDRYRFRALKAHGEVVFWTSGSSAPTEKFTGCQIDDGRNWSCPPSAVAAKTVTLRMLHGRPVLHPADGTKPFHAVEKWRWWLAKYDLPAGSEAGN